MALSFLSQPPRPKLASLQDEPRPLFIYGTLCAKPLLAWALTGSAENVDLVSRFLQPAWVAGYKRVAVHHCDYPAVVQDSGSVVEGFLLQLQTASQRHKLDDFEGEVYKPVPVVARLVSTGLTIRIDHDRDGVVNSTANDEVKKNKSNEPHNCATDSIECIVDADMYIWDGDMDQLSTEAWDLETFITTRLEDWIDLFDGMELVGDDDNSIN